MATPNELKLIYGAGGLSPAFANLDPTDAAFKQHVNETLKILQKNQIPTLDTAEIYPGSEETIGNAGATATFSVDTKIPGGFGAPRNKDQIIAGVREQLARLKTKQVDVLYFHAPDDNVSLEEQLSATNSLYLEGAFKRLGLSNYDAQQVQEAYDISKRNGWVLPTVYQGNYNAVARIGEEILFPTLRKLGIAFYAYSPIAGGFLAKTRAQVTGGEGRFDTSNVLGQLYSNLYGKEALLAGLDTWGQISDASGIPRPELAYRWIAFHSILRGDKGDGIIFGARNTQQTVETIASLRSGPLPEEVVEKIEALWQDVKSHAPVDNYRSTRN